MLHPIKTIFFGTPGFAVPALEALHSNARFEVVAVVTQPDRPTGRKKIITPSPVKLAAEKFKIPALQPEKLKDEAIEQIVVLKPDLAIVVAYGNLIPKRLLEAVPRGFVNIHPSLLPKHRGASPLTATILEGDKETGVCLMVLDEGMDHGPVIACRRVSLKGDETTDSLRAILTPIGADMIGKELVGYLDGKIAATPQDHDKATFCKQIESEGARIDWKKPAIEIDRLIRAMHGMTPAWTMLDGQMLLIHKASCISSSFPRRRESNAQLGRPITPPNEDWIPDVRSGMTITTGTVVKIKNSPAVSCADGYLLLDEIQLAGGKAMSGQAFLNGHKDLVGKILK
jgi:methionyl-tRNA formyltransferase